MEIEFPGRRFHIRVFEARSESSGAPPKLASETHSPEPGAFFFGSEAKLSPAELSVAVYNACLRFYLEENISKKLSYEVLVVLTGETQISKILQRCTASHNQAHKYCVVAAEETLYGGPLGPDWGEVELSCASGISERDASKISSNISALTSKFS